MRELSMVCVVSVLALLCANGVKSIRDEIVMPRHMQSIRENAATLRYFETLPKINDLVE